MQRSTNLSPSWLRSGLAIIAGSTAWMITALGTDNLLAAMRPEWFGAAGRVDDVGVLLFLLSYSLGFAVLAGYVTGWIAQQQEIRHALALGVLQLAMGTVATIAYFDVAPVWYHLTFLALLIPAHALGGVMRRHYRITHQTVPAASQ
jgi:uncharacterized membrane protein (DUF485 family)